MLETREKVLSRLRKLREVQFHKPTAMDLRGPRPLMARVGRQEQRLYKQRVLKQEKDFQVKLAKIQKYLSDLQAEEQRRLDLIESWEGNDEPVFQPIGEVVPKPVISIPGIPLQRRTRLQPRRRLKKLRRLR